MSGSEPIDISRLDSIERREITETCKCMRCGTEIKTLHMDLLTRLSEMIAQLERKQSAKIITHMDGRVMRERQELEQLDAYRKSASASLHTLTVLKMKLVRVELPNENEMPENDKKFFRKLYALVDRASGNGMGAAEQYKNETQKPNTTISLSKTLKPIKTKLVSKTCTCMKCSVTEKRQKAKAKKAGQWRNHHHRVELGLNE